MTSSPDSLGHRHAVVEGELSTALARLAWPAVVATGARATFAIADSIYIGHGLGAAALAAVATSSFVLWSLDSLTLAVSIGVSAVLARRVGRRDAAGQREVAAQGLLLAVVVSTLVAVVGWPVAPHVFVVMGLEGDVAAQGTAYLRVLLSGAAALFVFHAVEAAFRGAGNTRTPLVLLVSAMATNVALDPLLIFGLGPLPRMGVAGAAVATILAHGGAALVGLVLLRRQGLLPGLRDPVWRPRPRSWLELLRIGSPASANGVFFCVVYMFLARITATFGTPAVAALGAGHKGEAPCYFIGLGLGMAVAPLVGQSLGAGLPERAERAGWLAARWAGTFALAWTLVLVLAPELVARAFIDDENVVRLAGSYLFVIGWSQVFMAVELVMDGVFAGAGDTVPPLLVGLPLAAARIPLAWWLGVVLEMGTMGIWWAISLTGIARGVLLFAWFRRGRWKRHDVS